MTKDIASKPCCHHRWWRCYSDVLVLMRQDLGWPPAPHLPSSSWFAPAIKHCRHKNTPLKSVRIVTKDIASKPCCLHRWSRSYSDVSVLMRQDLGWPPAPHLPSSSWLAPVIKHCRQKKYPIKVGADSDEGYSIKAMLSLSMVEVLKRRLSPDEARLGVAASTTSYLLVICGDCNKAFRV